MKLIETEVQITATTSTLLRQVLAFLIDLVLISLPLMIHPSLEAGLWMLLVWGLYIPLAEYYYGRTLGMALVGTRIFALDRGRVPFSAVFRRHTARISIVWGVLGWLTLLAGTRIAEGYIILSNGEKPVREIRMVTPEAKQQLDDPRLVGLLPSYAERELIDKGFLGRMIYFFAVVLPEQLLPPVFRIFLFLFVSSLMINVMEHMYSVSSSYSWLGLLIGAAAVIIWSKITLTSQYPCMSSLFGFVAIVFPIGYLLGHMGW